MAELSNIPVEPLNLRIAVGATFSFVATWADSAGDPINLIGYTARMKFKRTFDSATAELSLTEGSGITLGGVLGTITVALTDTQTAAMSGTYYYDLELESAAGDVTRLTQGQAFAIAEITT